MLYGIGLIALGQSLYEANMTVPEAHASAPEDEKPSRSVTTSSTDLNRRIER